MQRRKATLQSVKHVQVQRISITISIALHSLKWSLHSLFLTAVCTERWEIQRLVDLEDLFILMLLLACLLLTFKSVLKTVSRGQNLVSVNQQNHAAKSIVPSSY